MDGVLIVDKPQGLTSHDVVDLVRKRFNLRKVGHAGTLDPIATGVLVILIGRYTKFSSSLTAHDKEYEATLVLGASSDTCDAWGRIENSGKPVDFEHGRIEDAFSKFQGHIEQLPPMYSAVKLHGRKLYELARRGLSVNRDPRKIFIEKIKILEVSLPQVSFRLTCSKGTYVRQFCDDIGQALGCGAYMSRLRRTRSGRFSIEQAMGIDDLKTAGREEMARRLITGEMK